MTRLKLFFDGGCRPNPGKMETAVVVRGIAHVRADVGWGASNEAEWLACRHALEIAGALGGTEIELVGDSLLVVRQARGEWKCRDLRLAQSLAAFRLEAARFARVRLRHVARAKNLAGIALQARHRGLGTDAV